MCWFIDTDYDMEPFFVRHACFVGANDPDKALKTTLKTEIGVVAWVTLNAAACNGCSSGRSRDESR